MVHVEFISIAAGIQHLLRVITTTAFLLITNSTFGFVMLREYFSLFQNQNHFKNFSRIKIQPAISLASARKIPIPIGSAAMMGYFISFHQKIHGTFTNSILIS